MTQQRRRKNKQRQHSPNLDVKGWYRHHRICAQQSLLSLLRQPLSSALTWLVIAIALLLPTLFYLVLQAVNTQTLAWQDGGQITLYLDKPLTVDEGLSLTDELIARPEINTASYVSQEDAWRTFRESLSLTDTASLEDNPLPASITLIPNQQSRADLEALIFVLQDLPEVDDIQIDLAWIERLNSALALLQSIVQLLAFILGFAVLLIVGNTIRLAIESRKAEIQIIKLLGATDSYVRRPFLYLGLWYGLFGGLAAWLFLTMISISFQTKLNSFLQTYGMASPSLWLGVQGVVLLLLTSVLVSLLGARIALWRYLKDTDPQ